MYHYSNTKIRKERKEYERFKVYVGLTVIIVSFIVFGLLEKVTN